MSPGGNTKEKPVMHWWAKLVRLIQLVFVEGGLLEEITWSMMVLLLKVKGGSWGIGVVEVVWKVCGGLEFKAEEGCGSL